MADDPTNSNQDDKPLDKKTLQELLEQHENDKRALRQEFEETASNTEAVTSKNADKRISSLAPDAYVALTYLVNNADSESVRLNAAKYILDITMGKKLPGAQTSEDKAIENLIESLRPKKD